jgi:glycosyltransferase involved in cell wall biosynthesis
MAVGKYIQFLDADDLISPCKLSVQIPIIESESADLVYSKSIFFAETEFGKVLINKYPDGFLARQTLKGYELLARIIKNNIITIGSPLVKKQALIDAGMFSANLKNNEDWLLWFKIALYNQNFVFDDNNESFAEIRVHNESAMNDHSKMFKGEVIVRNQIEVDLYKMKSTDELIQLRKLNLDLLALHEVRSLSVPAGMKYILSSFVKNPFREFTLLRKGLFKLSVRLFKGMLY